MIDIQTKMTERALELLCLPEGQPSYLLDIGCGSGLSGDYISEEGHYWVGIDISPAMLDAALDRDTEGDLLLGDMGQGVPFRPGSFDGCISISAVQWLCNANKKSDVPARRLYCFFSSLYSALVRGARAVLQLYPENSEQLELITTQATRAGFTGGVVVDFPNSAKAKKTQQVLGPKAVYTALGPFKLRAVRGMLGSTSVCFLGLPPPCQRGLTESEDADQASESSFTSERAPHKKARRELVKKSREWVLEKKERRRRQGKEVRPDTQYTGRKRKPRF
ncbi:Probable 18S rRNA (guanine-N(7))-methyltransferase [Apodemus speciosus]|uniref:Probable 18S rRNA (Guanine-N(7))-methyltransferase n=1 Tax=Apodemus speciosus TaxID=105296 RepID=A0ABQ0ETY2_APOSI